MIFSNMNNKLVILSVLALVVCSCGGGSGKSGKGRTENIPVRVMSVSSVQSTETKSYIGTVEASKSSYLRCRHSGTLVSLNVREGDEVKAGQILAEINSPTVISAREMAHATLKQAEDGYERSSALL